MELVFILTLSMQVLCGHVKLEQREVPQAVVVLRGRSWQALHRCYSFYPRRCCVDVSSLSREKSHKLWLSLEDGAGKLFILLTLSPCRCCVDVSSLSREKSHKLWLSLEDGAGKLFIILTVSATTGELTVLKKVQKLH
jgi:hypothetical protein